jgi:hypothetical protein
MRTFYVADYKVVIGGPAGIRTPNQGIMSHIFSVLHGLAWRGIYANNIIYINRYEW